MKKELKLYVHIPFCVKKCNYCDFLSASSSPQARRRYINGLTKEITSYEERMKGYEVTSVFIGGGTPSLLSSEEIVDLFYAIHVAFHIRPRAEITIEINPGTITEEKLRTYKKVGINRLSFGLQSAVDEELQTLGRIHNFEQFENNIELARKLGFQNINIDVMSGIPGQTFDSYLYTLEKVLQQEPEHISAYSLIVEEGTPFYNWQQEGKLFLPEEEEERLMYERTREVLEYFGYYRYEISNYAKAGFQSDHNIGYWTRKEYLGLGLGASSLLDETRFNNIKDREEYLELVEKDGFVPEDIRCNVEMIGQKEQMTEFMILGLRMAEGIFEEEFEEIFGVELESMYSTVIRKYESLGLMQWEDGFVSLTDQGISVSNQILADFM